MSVLTLPRVRRRHDGDETGTWMPVAATVDEPVAHAEVENAGVTQRVVRRVDGLGLGSVAKLALLFYGCVFASLAGGVLIMWAAISSLGYIHRFEHFMRSIGFRGFVVSANGIVFGLIGIAGALTLLATLLTLAVACAYNVVGSAGHGLVLKMSEPIAPDADAMSAPTPVEASTDTPVEAASDTSAEAPAEDGASHAA
jgi:hypothetical protein